MTTTFRTRGRRSLAVLVSTVMLLGAAGTALAVPLTVAYTDTGNRQWASLIGTQGLSWDSIRSVCGEDGSVCSANVGGVELKGWTWATREQVRDVFIELAPSELNSANLADWIDRTANTTYGPTLVSLFGPTHDSTGDDGYSQYAYGRTATRVADNYHYLGTAGNRPSNSLDFVIFAGAQINDSAQDDFIGAWLFRVPTTPPSEVPEPGTLALLGLGCAALAFARRRRPG